MSLILSIFLPVFVFKFFLNVCYITLYFNNYFTLFQEHLEKNTIFNKKLNKIKR